MKGRVRGMSAVLDELIKYADEQLEMYEKIAEMIRENAELSFKEKLRKELEIRERYAARGRWKERYEKLNREMEE